MRVLLLCTDAYGGHGGIALYNRDLAEALAALPEVEEVLVVPRVIRRDPGEIPPKIRFFPEAAKGHVHYLRAVEQARRAKPSLVICGHINLLAVACMVAKRPVLMVYGIEAWKRPRTRTHRLLHRCRAIISISAITRDRFLGWSHYAGKTHLLPNAIHAEQYGVHPKPPALVERYDLQGKRVLLTVGRLESEERYKGFDEVLEILPNLPRDIVYIIAGMGNDRGRLQAKAERLDIADRVVFTGFFPDAGKVDLYNLADVYVMPSRGEGFGFVFLEAIASGIPAIGSKDDGGREALLSGELGLLVDPANATEIEAAIIEQLRQTERSVPERLRYFSFENFVARTAAIVDDVVR
jgi:glycosyltransferase involved in cell wall biosynthesis